MKEEILDILKNADGYISGERISEMLNVSRTAIWKHIKSLRESGYKIESVTNKGYRLISSPDIITESGIKSGLTTDLSVIAYLYMMKPTRQTIVQRKAVHRRTEVYLLPKFKRTAKAVVDVVGPLREESAFGIQSC